MLKIINKIKQKYCKHNHTFTSFEPITENSHYEWVHCYKCGMVRKDLYSLGHKVEGEWYAKD